MRSSPVRASAFGLLLMNVGRSQSRKNPRMRRSIKAVIAFFGALELSIDQVRESVRRIVAGTLYFKLENAVEFALDGLRNI